MVWQGLSYYGTNIEGEIFYFSIEIIALLWYTDISLH